MKIKNWLAVLVLVIGAQGADAQGKDAHRTVALENNDIIIKANAPIAEVQPTMWGIFFEDINLGADGGIYAELVKNRSFEFYEPMMGWKVRQSTFREGSVLVLNRKEVAGTNPRFLRVKKSEPPRISRSGSNAGAGPDALPKLTNRPRRPRLAIVPSKVSLPTAS